MTYLLNPAHHNEVVQYVARYHKLDPTLAEKAFTAQIPAYSKDGTKLRSAVEREIDPDASPHRLEPQGPVERLADALTRSAAQTLATDTANSSNPKTFARRARLLRR